MSGVGCWAEDSNSKSQQYQNPLVQGTFCWGGAFNRTAGKRRGGRVTILAIKLVEGASPGFPWRRIAFTQYPKNAHTSILRAVHLTLKLNPTISQEEYMTFELNQVNGTIKSFREKFSGTLLIVLFKEPLVHFVSGITEAFTRTARWLYQRPSTQSKKAYRTWQFLL